VSKTTKLILLDSLLQENKDGSSFIRRPG